MKHFGESESLLSSAVEKETYNTIGNTYENNGGDQKKRKTVCCLIACLLILAVIGFALLTTVLSLYDLNVFESSCLHSGNNLVLSEDYILLLHSCQNKLDSTEKLLYKNSIKFFVDTNINPVEIFSISCDSLTLMVEQFPKSQSHQNSTFYTLPQQVYFKNCSNYTDICILDEFVYQVPSNNSAIIYNITLDFYNPNETDVQIVAFDNFMNFNNFLTGGKMSNSLKSLKMTDTSAIFILDSSDMRRSSYYFFAVKTFKNTNWFIKTSAGTRVFYNVSNTTPDCVLTARKKCCEIEIRESNQCYLGHVKDNATEGEKLTIHHQPIAKQGYVSTLGMVLLLMIIIVLLVIATIKILHSKRKKSKLSTCSYGVHKNGYKTGHKTIEKIPFDENGLLHHWPEYGITICIPEGAVHRSATLQFEASFLSTNFKCGGNFRPVSPFVWIHFDQELAKPAKLYIPHDVVIENDEQLHKLHILTRNHDVNASFKVNNELDAEISDEIVCVRAKHFCSLCLALKALKGEELKTKYHMIYAIIHKSEDEVYVDICILQSRDCRKLVKGYYEKRGFECSSAKQVYFEQGDEGIKYSVELPKNVGWKHTERGATQSKIQQKHVDVYKVLGVSAEEITQKCIKELEGYEADGEYPPRFRLCFFKESDSIKKKCPVKIVLHGLDPEVSISFLLNNEGRGASLEDSYTDSAIYETIPFLKSMLKDQQQLFFNFCHSLGLDQGFSQQIFSSTGPDINSCLKEALTEWRKSSHCPDPMKVIARALASSTGIDTTMDDGYAVITDTREISLQSLSDISDSTSQGNHQIYDILCSLPSSSKLNSEPEFREFHTHIVNKLPSEWERFGTQLRMPQPALEIIRANRPGDIVMCFHDLFNKWKRNSCSSFTWSTVLAVLCYLDEYRVAKDLCNYL